MPLKLYGYSTEAASVEAIRPSELAEVTLVASPEDLRKIAEFLASAAAEMERMGSAYSHEHLADKHPRFRDSPHLVVFSPEATS